MLLKSCKKLCHRKRLMIGVQEIQSEKAGNKEQCRELCYLEGNMEPDYREQVLFRMQQKLWYIRVFSFDRPWRVDVLSPIIKYRPLQFCTLVKVLCLYQVWHFCWAYWYTCCPCCLWNTDFSVVVVCLLRVVALDRFGDGRCFLLADLALILTTICLVWCFIVEIRHICSRVNKLLLI